MVKISVDRNYYLFLLFFLPSAATIPKGPQASFSYPPTFLPSIFFMVVFLFRWDYDIFIYDIFYVHSEGGVTMSNCANCSGPLPVDSMVCRYCGTRNDIDLKGIQSRVEVHESPRICPRCDKPLQTVDLKLEGRFLIERCCDCMGMFFDPGELETLLGKSVTNVFHIDRRQLENIGKVRRHEEYGVSYIKCPVCRKLMQRKNFGAQSGVIVDTCKGDGIWLDGGELRALMEWTKAGGQLLHQQKTQEIESLERRLSRQRAQPGGTMPVTGKGPFDTIPFDDGYDSGSVFPVGGDVLGGIGRAISTIFRLF